MNRKTITSCTSDTATCALSIITAPHLPRTAPRFRRNVLGVEVLVKSFVTAPAGTTSCG